MPWIDSTSCHLTSKLASRYRNSHASTVLPGVPRVDGCSSIGARALEHSCIHYDRAEATDGIWVLR